MRLLYYLKFLWSKKVKKETTAQRAYRLLKDIPADKWAIGNLHINGGKSCFLGHYQRLTGLSGDESAYQSDIALEAGRFLMNVHKISRKPHNVNDFDNINGYNEDHPKKRVMHLLKDMIEKGY